MKIAVFTVCMPEYTPEEAVPKLAKWGFDGVEWRVTRAPEPGEPVKSFWQGNRCTIDMNRVPELAPALRKLCRKHKLETPVLGTYYGYKDLKLIEEAMDAASVMEHWGLRVYPGGYNGRQHFDAVVAESVKGWKKVVKLGRKYGVKPLVEIHMGNIVPSCSAARRFADHFSPEEIGIIHDAGNMVSEGYENWQMGLEILGPYLAHVHVKNRSWSIREADKDGNLRWACGSDTLRRGQADWRDIIRALVAVGYDGWLSLEDFETSDTKTKLKDDLKYLRKLLRKEAK